MPQQPSPRPLGAAAAAWRQLAAFAQSFQFPARSVFFAAGATTACMAVSGWHSTALAASTFDDSMRAAMVTVLRKSAERDYPGLGDDPSFQAAVDAISQLDRSKFVPTDVRPYAHLLWPLPIGFDQTISSPYIVAVMTAAVKTRPGANILEVGTGSGYQAAVASRIGATVHSLEIVPGLALAAAKRLKRLHCKNVSIKAGDGFAGWPEFAPYDGIIVTAGAALVPAPLLAQLKPGGVLVMPVGANTYVEQLTVFTKEASGSISRCSLGPVMFVPLTGAGQTPEAAALYDRSVPLCRKGQTARWPGQPAG